MKCCQEVTYQEQSFFGPVSVLRTKFLAKCLQATLSHRLQTLFLDLEQEQRMRYKKFGTRLTFFFLHGPRTFGLQWCPTRCEANQIYTYVSYIMSVVCTNFKQSWGEDQLQFSAWRFLLIAEKIVEYAYSQCILHI